MNDTIPLWTVEQARACAQQKLNNRPVSTDKRGFIKISGKSSPHQTRMIRHINLIKANSHGR